MSQTENDNFKKLKIDIEKNGIINPLICTEKEGKYRLCMGQRRFIAGCLLGIEKYNIEIVAEQPTEVVEDPIISEITEIFKNPIMFKK